MSTRRHAKEAQVRHYASHFDIKTYSLEGGWSVFLLDAENDISATSSVGSSLAQSIHPWSYVPLNLVDASLLVQVLMAGNGTKRKLWAITTRGGKLTVYKWKHSQCKFLKDGYSRPCVVHAHLRPRGKKISLPQDYLITESSARPGRWGLWAPHRAEQVLMELHDTRNHFGGLIPGDDICVYEGASMTRYRVKTKGALLPGGG